MKLKPLNHRVLIKKDALKEKTASGIILPSKDTDRPQTGQVTAIGEEVKAVKVGQFVYFAKYAGKEIDGEYIILEEKELLATIE